MEHIRPWSWDSDDSKRADEKILSVEVTWLMRDDWWADFTGQSKTLGHTLGFFNLAAKANMNVVKTHDWAAETCAHGNHSDKWEKRRSCCLHVAITAAAINRLEAKWPFRCMAPLQSSLTSPTTLKTSPTHWWLRQTRWMLLRSNPSTTLMHLQLHYHSITCSIFIRCYWFI